MKILIAAGGTGGHIYPGLAIADVIKRKLPEAEILFIGSRVGMEKNIVPKAGYAIEYIRARGFERELSLETLAAVKGIFDSIFDSKKILKKHQPNLVIGTGGFTCAMLLREAAAKGIPTMIHEQNAYPGKSNRMLGSKVDRIAISFKEAATYFPEEKVFLAGNPVRDVFKTIQRKEARRILGIKEGQRLVVIMGGSQGASSINKAACEVVAQYAKDPSTIIYHLTGRDQYAMVAETLKQRKVTFGEGTSIRVLPYSDKVHLLTGAADLAVSRSGAMSVAEFAAVGLPTLLVPYPQAAGNHQEFNARVLTDRNAGILIRDDELNGELLLHLIDELLLDRGRLDAMRRAAREAGILDADERIYAEISTLLAHA